MSGRDFISVQAGRAQGKSAKMLELFIQYVLEHTGWKLDEIALYQKYDRERDETISWIEKKPQVDFIQDFQVESGEDYEDHIRNMSPVEYQRMVLGTWDGEEEE